jgi:hypothetical protein
MKKIILCLFLCSCSALKMKRPEPELYNQLKELKLFGTWRGRSTHLQIHCTGGFDYLEMRNGEVFNKDKGGDISALDKVKREIAVSSLFGTSLYSFKMIDPKEMDFFVGKRAGVVGKLIDIATTYTYVPENRAQRLKRVQTLDCDKAPKNLGEVLSQVKEQLKAGNYTEEGDTLLIKPTHVIED